MKYNNFYQKNKITENNVFNELISNLKSSIKVWEYFVNWDKVNNNVRDINIELNLLNSLIGSSNLEKDFIDLIKKYPTVLRAIPFLLAVRETKLEIIKDYKNQDLTYLTFEFDTKKPLTDDDAKNYFMFLEKSGLVDLFHQKSQNYCYSLFP